MKRVLVSLALTLLLSQLGFAQSAHVQTQFIDTSGSSVLFPAMTTTAANMLLVCVRFGSTGTYGISDDKSDTYTVIYNSYADGFTDFVACWYSANIAGGSTTITVTASGSGTERGHAMEFSGLVTSTPLDQNTHTETASVTSAGSGNITSTQAAEMWVGFLETQQTISAITAGTLGSGTGTIPTNGTTVKTGVEYHHESATQTGAANFSWTTTANASVVVLSFKDSGGAASINPHLFPLLGVGP